MKKFIRSLTASATLTVLLLIATTSFASLVTLADNLSQPTDSSASINNDWSMAQSFRTNATAFTLNSVALPLQKEGIGTTGTFAMQVYDTTGANGTPGQKVADIRTAIDAATLGTTEGSVYEATGLSTLLSAGTEYYLVLNSENLTGKVYWDWTNSVAGTGFPSSYTSNYGSGWGTPTSSSPQKMQIVASDATSVPEPSTYALLTIALGVVGFARKKMLNREG